MRNIFTRLKSSHSGHSYWWVKKSWWFAVKNLLIIVLLISTFVLMRNCWWAFFRWSLKTNIKCCFYTVTTFCFSFLATLTKAKHFNHRNNLMINTWTKVCLGKTILCVQTQRKGWWWQRSTIFLSLPLLLFFLVMIVKKAKKKATPKTADYQPLLFFSEVSIVWHKTIFRETKWKATNENRV